MTGQRINKARKGGKKYFIATYVYGFMSAVLDPYSRFLDHIQVGSGHYKGSVSTRTKRRKKTWSVLHLEQKVNFK